jgi:hypothetical protein
LNGQFYIALLNPSIGLILAAVFFSFWRYQRERRYAAALALGYVASALGFILQDIGPCLASPANKIASNSCFLLSASCTGAAIVARYGRAQPYLGLRA